MDEVKDQFLPDNQVIEIRPLKCEHLFIRVSATEVGCSLCPNRWIDGGHFILKDNKIIGKR